MRLDYRCPLRFTDLDGDGVVRGCWACGRTVADLSTLTEDDARRYVRANPGTCGRALRTPSGGWFRRQVPLVAAASALVVAEPCTEQASVPSASIVLPAADPVGPPASPGRRVEVVPPPVVIETLAPVDLGEFMGLYVDLDAEL